MNELIDKLLERGDDLSNEAAEALKELADIKLVGGMVKAPRWLVMETRASRQSPRQSEMRSALRYSSSECRSRSISRTSVYRRITMTGTIVVKTLWFLEKVQKLQKVHCLLGCIVSSLEACF